MNKINNISSNLTIITMKKTILLIAIIIAQLLISCHGDEEPQSVKSNYDSLNEFGVDYDTTTIDHTKVANDSLR